MSSATAVGHHASSYTRISYTRGLGAVRRQHVQPQLVAVTRSKRCSHLRM
jgi:hypothetical protein